MHRDREKERSSRGREKEKTRDRDHDKDREREKDRPRDRDRDRESRKSEKESRDHEADTDHRDRDRKDRDRRERYREERDREREREKEKEREEKDRQKEREEKGRQKERKRRESDRPRDKDRKDGDRDAEGRDADDDRERKRRKHEEDQQERESRNEREKHRDREVAREKIKDEEEERDRDRKRRRKEEEAGKAEVKGKKDAEEGDPEEEQRKLDEEMEKRRRRVQEWQELRRRKEEEERKKRGDVEEGANPQSTGKAWTLEGDDDSDEEDAMKGDASKSGSISQDTGVENGDTVMVDQQQEDAGKENGKEEDEEVDPLDAFMNSMVLPEVEKLNAEDALRSAPPDSGKEKGAAIITNGKNSTMNPSRKATGRILPGDDSESGEENDDMEDPDEEDDDEFMKRVKKTKAEKLALVDHSKIQYMPFRKNFYIEVKEITRMSPEEVSAFRRELELKIRGKDVPRPVKTWNQTGLSNKPLEVIKKLGFEKPMPIQAQALPIIMSGRDCIGVAKTGSGKTLAFVLPMLRHIKDQPPLAPGDGPIGLIMAPTRELVQQIFNDIKKFSKVMGLTAVPVYGGSGVAQQISDLKRGTEIVVCTPGRMIDILCTSSGKITNLRRVTYLVLDEADRMFDMGFEPQITRIVQNTRPDRQTVLFSATFPRQVEVLARKVLNQPVEIQVGGRSVVNKDITQSIEVRPDGDRFLRLLELLGEWFEKGKILVFVHSQDKCDSLFRELVKAGYPCLSLHGAKDQTDRESTISDFKSNVCNLLIATSIAARGLDVKELELVVNYDVPNHYEDYVHRVGRTGRAGRKGCAITFISEDEARYAPDLVKALELSEQPIPEDLKKLADGFMAKVSLGTEQSHGSGYGGSGFKFNEEEDEALRAAKKAQAKEYGFEEDEDKSDSDSDDDSIRKAGGDLAQVAAAAAMVVAKAATNPLLTVGQGVPGMSLPGVAPTIGLPGVSAGLPNLATFTGSTGLPVIPGLGYPGLGVGAVSSMPTDPAAKAAALAAVLQHNLSKIQADALPEHYEAELEINDFPQHARWKVTHKDSLGPISDWTGAAITTRGQHFPPGKVPAPGERKLYLFIEGPTENSVKKAKTEIKRILEECTAAAISLPSGGQPGKYSVL